MNKHTLGAKQAHCTRIFLPTGVRFRVGPRWQIGMDFRLGMGWQFVPGHATNVIEFTNAVLVGVRYGWVRHGIALPFSHTALLTTPVR